MSEANCLLQLVLDNLGWITFAVGGQGVIHSTHTINVSREMSGEERQTAVTQGLYRLCRGAPHADLAAVEDMVVGELAALLLVPADALPADLYGADPAVLAAYCAVDLPLARLRLHLAAENAADRPLDA
jgi:hypothetical protein